MQCFIKDMQSTTVQAVKLVALVREIPSESTGRGTDYTDWGVSFIIDLPWTNVGLVA
jgi:hypothetical protein